MANSNDSSNDSTHAHTTNKLVDDAKFANTKQADPRYKDFVAKVDDTGKTLYTNNLKVTTLQIDRNFPTVITAEKVKRIVDQYTDNNQTLLYIPDVDYMLSGEVQEFDEDAERELPASMQAFFKPISLRDSVSF